MTKFTSRLDRKQLIHELEVAEQKAWDSLGRYKFQMFGYWAGVWVHLNRVGEFRLPNPFRDLVQVAREGTLAAERLAAGMAVGRKTEADRHYQAGYDDAVAYFKSSEAAP